MRPKNSIAIPITLFFLVIVAGIFATGYFINKNVFYTVFEERESNKSKNIHLTINSILSLETKKLSSLSKVLKNDTDLYYGLYHYQKSGGDRKPLAAAMKQLHSQVNLPTFIMATSRGQVLYSSDKTENQEKPAASEAFQKALKGQQVLAVTRAGGRWSMRSFVPISLSESNTPTGVLILGNRIDDEFVSKIARETGSQLFLATGDDVIAASYRAEGPLRIDQTLARKTLAEQRPLFYTDRENFRSYTYVPLQILGNEFCLVIETDISVIKDLLGKNKAKLSEWGILLFLAIMLLGCAVMYMLIRPLSQLETKARQVIVQYSGEEPDLSPGGNEISTLVRAINTMVNTVEKHIANRVRAEEALRESSYMLESLVEASPLAIFETDRSGRIRVWNPASENIFGWTREEALNQQNPVFTGGSNPELKSACDRTLLGEGFSHVEIAGTDRNGSGIVLSFSGAPLLDRTGKAYGMTAIVADITEAKQAEEALRRSEEKLVQSQKMEAVGRLAGGVAHDFNNLLSVIMGYSELLLFRLGERSRERHEIEEIFKAGERASFLTQQLLAFSRLQVLKPKVFRMNEVVTDHSKMLRRLIGETFELSINLAPDIWPVKADPNQIGQVLMNLVVNARDAMPGRGRISISNGNVELGEPLVEEKQAIPEGRYVRVEVTDAGCGMDPDTKARIFEPFFTTKEQGKGTGLGLATVYGIVKQSGAYIIVASSPGEGTTFSLYFPAAEESEAVEEEVRTPEKKAATEGKTLLIVEDEEIVREMACEALKRFGYFVLEASTGPEAIALSEEHPGPIHLLITDMVMPGMNGTQLASELTASRPGLLVLFVSGYSREAVTQLGDIDARGEFLQKPITPTNLLASVREILSGNGDPARTVHGGDSSGDPHSGRPSATSGPGAPGARTR